MYDRIFDTEEGKAGLTLAVEHYQHVYLPCEERDRAYYRGLMKKNAALKAGLLLRHDERRHSHAEDWVGRGDSERRAASLELFAKQLVGRVGKMRKGMSFPEIHALVEEAATHVQKARQPKPPDLLRYDAALMLAWRLKGEPEEVWLHSGTDWGYRTLGCIRRGKKTIPLDELPEPFRELPASYVEDILCIYRLVFVRLLSGKAVDEALLDKAAAKQRMACGHSGCTRPC